LCIKLLLLTSSYLGGLQVIHKLSTYVKGNWWITPFPLLTIFCYNEVGRSGELWEIVR
jgi:hypothetical protein